MSPEEIQFTTFRIDTETLETLRTLAESDFRSMASEIRYLVDKEMKERGLVSSSEKQQPQPEQG